MSHSPSHTIPPYGVAIQHAISAGNLPQMKTLLEQRNSSATEPPELRTAYEHLAQEVARLERR